MPNNNELNDGFIFSVYIKFSWNRRRRKRQNYINIRKKFKEFLRRKKYFIPQRSFYLFVEIRLDRTSTLTGNSKWTEVSRKRGIYLFTYMRSSRTSLIVISIFFNLYKSIYQLQSLCRYRHISWFRLNYPRCNLQQRW